MEKVILKLSDRISQFKKKVEYTCDSHLNLLSAILSEINQISKKKRWEDVLGTIGEKNEIFKMIDSLEEETQYRLSQVKKLFTQVIRDSVESLERRLSEERSGLDMLQPMIKNEFVQEGKRSKSPNTRFDSYIYIKGGNNWQKINLNRKQNIIEKRIEGNRSYN